MGLRDVSKAAGAQIFAIGLGVLAVALLGSRLLEPSPDARPRVRIANASWLVSGLGPPQPPAAVEEPAVPEVAQEPQTSPTVTVPAPEPPPPAKPLPEPDRTAITGRVITARGRDVPAAFVIDVVPEFDGGTKSVAVPNRDGTFRTAALVPGSYTLKGRTAYGLLCGTSVGVSSGTRDLRLSIHSPGEIAGRVLDSEGRPAKAGILVIAETADYGSDYKSFPWYGGKGRRSTAWTQEDGTFVIEYLGDFEFTVRLSDKAQPASSRTLVNPDRLGAVVSGVRLGRRDVTLNLLKPPPPPVRPPKPPRPGR